MIADERRGGFAAFAAAALAAGGGAGLGRWVEGRVSMVKRRGDLAGEGAVAREVVGFAGGDGGGGDAGLGAVAVGVGMEAIDGELDGHALVVDHFDDAVALGAVGGGVWRDDAGSRGRGR